MYAALRTLRPSKLRRRLGKREPPPAPASAPMNEGDVAEVRRAFRRVTRVPKPIVVGPWVSEVGFEVLYWIPMLRRLLKSSGVDARNITAISRGGAEPWYEGLASRYIDIFDYLSPEEFRRLRKLDVASSGSQKQMEVSALDREILSRVADELEEGYDLLHPSLMYRLFWPLWTRRLPLAHWHAETHYRRMPKSSSEKRFADTLDALPKDFVAVKFYFSDCLPDSERNRALVGRVVSAVGADRDIVTLDTGINVDDHVDVAVGVAGGRVHGLADAMQPSSNLALQTAVIRRARAFIGTYGGFSYVAPFLGVASLSFYSVDNFNPTHLDTMRRAMQIIRSDVGAHTDFSVINLESLVRVGILQAPGS